MRAFLLIALLAMATTVSCQSAECNTTTAALDVPAVKTAQAAVGHTGCNGVDFSDIHNTSVCTFNAQTVVYTCNCAGNITNYEAFESGVKNITGRDVPVCIYDLSFALTGTLKVNETNTTVTLNAVQTQAGFIAVGANCTASDTTIVFTGLVGEATEQFVKANLNGNSADTDITWATGTATIVSTNCGVTAITSASTVIPPPAVTPIGNTTLSPTTSAPTGNTTLSPTTSAPTGNTTLSPTSTPAPGGNTTNTPPTTPAPQGGDASSIATSAVLVASLIAATVTIVA